MRLCWFCRGYDVLNLVCLVLMRKFICGVSILWVRCSFVFVHLGWRAGMSHWLLAGLAPCRPGRAGPPCGAIHLVFVSLDLDLCLHLFGISFLVFGGFVGGVLLCSIVNDFSVEHVLHLLVPHLYGLRVAVVSHSILCSSSFSFGSQMYVDNLVSFLCVSLLELLVWLWGLVLNGVSHDPGWTALFWFVLAVAL